MKRIFVLCFCFLVCVSCIEEHHEVKESVRDYLKKTLNNPEFEEVDWKITKWCAIDNKYTNKPMSINKEKTKTLDETNLIILKYRTKNTFNAIILDTLYIAHYKDTVGKFKRIKKTILLNNFVLEKGKTTYKEFLEEYPEFKN